MALRTRLALAGGALALAGSVALHAQNPRDRHNTGPESFTSRVVAAGLGNPWEVTWGPDGFLWATERTTFRVVRINPDDGTVHVALVLEGVYQSVDQDGLLGMALHPDLLRARGTDYVYVAYVYDADPGAAVLRQLRLRRYTYDAGSQTLGAPLTLLDGLPAHDDHGGGRLVFGPDRKLYLSRGDQGSNFLANFCNPNRSQDLPSAADVQAHDWTTYQGKILRLNPDGSIPDDNPVIAGVRSHIYTWGHRNPQGLVFSPRGLLYEAEHGPSSDDEMNLIRSGGNYGWPEVAGYKDDRGYFYANWSASSPASCRSLTFNNLNPPPSVPRQAESSWQHPDFVPPLATFFTVPPDYDFAKFGTATVAPSGIDLYTAATIPGWRESVLMTGMRAGAVYRIKLTPDGAAASGEPVEYFKTTNRYRDLAISPDGQRIFVSTDDHGVTQDGNARRSNALANPGAILEFRYVSPSTDQTRNK
ncbi:MAG TPA: glucose/sorbosone family PQQ-dependent dehydrogenase [Vicinamibacterales bacterium]|nr:glucose/sorbosone family PQQ-dependent dehydrogenase [Vicinamibacterales bacterium]